MNEKIQKGGKIGILGNGMETFKTEEKMWILFSCQPFTSVHLLPLGLHVIASQIEPKKWRVQNLCMHAREKEREQEGFTMVLKRESLYVNKEAGSHWSQIHLRILTKKPKKKPNLCLKEPKYPPAWHALQREHNPV